ncbi:dephospho-CoA kinase [Pelagibacterales bacterium SAG-MED31]|nr:dephospho-CoA kinase [Pelagibacterales bacterium SAG-MED31]
MTKIVAITGGIGSGKTTLSKYLNNLGFVVHESDKVVSAIYSKPSKPFINILKKNISNNVVRGGKINKKKVAHVIFNNNQIKKNLETYIHKEVEKSRDLFIKKNIKNKKGVIFVDIPLLLEKKLEKKFTFVICIISQKKIRTERVLKNKKFSKTVLKKILISQTTDKERKTRSQIIIYNNKTKKDFIFSVKKALIKVLK